MKKRIKNLMILCAIVLLCSACTTPGNGGNKPYEPDRPAPDLHEGNFVSEHGSMRFNGDGKTVILDFDEELSRLSGLPCGKQNASYVFLSGDLPPNGSVDVRYDIAHELKITLGEQSVILQVGIASQDGSKATAGLDMVTPERIPLLFQENGKLISILFEKE